MDYLARGLDRLGYSAVNLGVRDFSSGAEYLEKLSKKSKFDFISANAFYKVSGERFTRPYRIFKLKAESQNSALPFKRIRIGVIGLCDEVQNVYSHSEGGAAVETRDPVAIAPGLVNELRSKADLVILLYHGRYNTLETLLLGCPGIDVAVMGKEYYMAGRSSLENVILVSSPSLGKYLGILDLELNADKKIVGHDNVKLALDENIEDDAEMVKLIQDFAGKYEKARQQQMERNRAQ